MVRSWDLRIKNWNIYELIWLALFATLAVVLALVAKDTWFGFSVFITGVLCVVLAAKGNIWTYFFGMYNTFAYAYLAYTNGLLGEMGLNLYDIILRLQVNTGAIIGPNTKWTGGFLLKLLMKLPWVISNGKNKRS
jgi:nicotinamide riboside transporter PnuC